jgi:predicted small lipoprotein YifL
MELGMRRLLGLDRAVAIIRGTSMTAVRSLIVVAMLAGLVAACGVRGPLEPPPGAEDEPVDPPFILDPLVD